LKFTYSINKIVSKVYWNGVTYSDSTIYYISNNKLDSVADYVNSFRLLQTFTYDVSNTLIYYKNYLNNPSVEPTYTNFSNGNLISTFYTYNTGPSPFYADSSYYTYTNQINNLVPSAFGMNFNTGILSLGTYQISNSKNTIDQSTKNYYIGNTIDPTIIKATSVSNSTYVLDSENRIIRETITIVDNPSQSTVHLFEYY